VTDRDLATEATPEPSEGRDPFAPIEAPPRGRQVLAVLALVAAVLAAIGGLAPLAGPVGMVLGLVAHVKGSRLGLPAAVLAGVGMIVGFSIMFLLR
jgi:uncharacterized membrane protein